MSTHGLFICIYYHTGYEVCDILGSQIVYHYHQPATGLDVQIQQWLCENKYCLGSELEKLSSPERLSK